MDYRRAFPVAGVIALLGQGGFVGILGVLTHWTFVLASSCGAGDPVRTVPRELIQLVRLLGAPGLHASGELRLYAVLAWLPPLPLAVEGWIWLTLVVAIDLVVWTGLLLAAARLVAPLASHARRQVPPHRA